MEMNPHEEKEGKNVGSDDAWWVQCLYKKETGGKNVRGGENDPVY